MNHDSIIISKKKRAAKHDEHSSAWKLAFADLMICLMCLFLVLWALEVSSAEERENIIEYFQTGEMPESTPGSKPGTMAGSTSPIDLFSFQDQSNPIKADRNNSLIQGEYNTQEELEILLRKVTDYIEEIGAENYVFVQVIPDGLRIVLADGVKNKMFKLGESTLTPFYKEMLLKFSTIFNHIENGIAISGHTDAVLFKGRSKSNWELSTQRANEARATMELGGLQSDNIVQVLGLANTKPLDEVDLNSSVNRRVEVILLARSAKDKLNEMYSNHNDNLTLDVYSKNNSASLE